MKSSSKVAIVAGLGAIAGGVAGYYLNSDKGREQRKQAADTIKQQSAKAAGYVGDLASRAKTTASQMVGNAQNVVENASNQAAEVKNDLVDASNKQLDKLENNFSNGQKRATV